MVELIKPEFIVGSEKRFFGFISELKGKGKIALISHKADLDGITAAKVANAVLKADLIKLVDYENIDLFLVKALKKNKIKKVIFTDLHIDKIEIIREIEKFADVLIIDHHKVEYDFNSEKTVFLNAQDFCAGYLTYYLFSKVQDIEKLDWLVACSCISDYCHVRPAVWLSKVFYKYGDKFERNGLYVRKSGVFWDLQYKLSLAIIYFDKNTKKVFDSVGQEFGNIGALEKYSEKVRTHLRESFSNFENEKISFLDGYFWEFTPKYKIGGMLSSIFGSKYPDKTVIVARKEGKFYNFSARRQDKKKDMDLLLKNLIRGFKGASAGGHIAAGGGHVMLRDKEEFKRRLGLGK